MLWRLRGLETLFAETTNDALRTLQGGVLLRWAIVALLVTAGVQLVVALLHKAVPWPRWSTIAAGAVVLAVVLVVAVGGSGRYVQSHGGAPWVKDRLHALVTDADTSGGGERAGTAVHAEHQRTGRRCGGRPRGSGATTARPAPAPARSPSPTTASARTGASPSTRTASGSTC